ncbi:MAG TPA: aspartate/glutamate racemase family protein [Acetobacteraceae bacterium]|nr:aspartate/glutamate racemase family protein [Acetobacteraceae bacterium]
MTRSRVFHGVAIGILMLRTGFRRFPGDVGHAATFPFPVQYRVVREATPEDVADFHDGRLLPAFRDAARALVEEGVDAIATSCGFLACYQRELAASVPVPVASSALLQLPMVARMLPAGLRVGVLTYDAGALGRAHLEAVGAEPDTPVVGLPADGGFVRAIRGGDAAPDFEALAAEAVDAAARLAAMPGVGAIVCECTNLGPFAAAIAARTGLPVFDVVSLVRWLHDGLRPRSFA